MKLASVYDVADGATYLYALLLEREPSQNISHKAMPTPAQHLAFVRSRPYREWFLIEVRGKYVGAAYLTKQNEIGIFIFRDDRGNGYGKQAVQMLVRRHKGERLVANINPDNGPSMAMFKSLGGVVIQHTLEVPTC